MRSRRAACLVLQYAEMMGGARRDLRRKGHDEHLEHFAQAYPERLWIDYVDDAARGFLAYKDLFRNDPWGAVQPGPNDIDTLNALVEAVEASVSDEILWFHLHTNFRRVSEVFRNRGYRAGGHKTCMVLEGQAGVWPQASESLLIRPWWS